MTSLTVAATAEAGSAPSPVRAELVAVSTSLVPFGLALGLAVGGLGIDPVAGIVGAGLVYGGSAQLTAMTLMASGAVVSAVLAATLVNARLLLYGAALDRHFRDQPRWFRLLGPHFIVDSTYLAAVARTDLGTPATFRRYWLRMGLCVLVVWTAAVAAGVLLAPVLPPMPHVGLVGAGLFLSMLVPRLRQRPGLAAAGVSALVAPLVAMASPGLGIVVGAAAGMAAAAWSRRARP